MPIYRKPTEQMVELLAKEMARHHQRLVDVDLIVDILAAHPKTDESGEPMEPALKLAGYPCLATIKIRGPKDRGEGRGDAMLTIDGYRWDELDLEEKFALLDHELTHLELDCDGKGNVKRDDYGRPKLTIRLHDHQFGWFDAVAMRHGESSIEVQQFATFRDGSGQLYWEFAAAVPGNPGAVDLDAESSDARGSTGKASGTKGTGRARRKSKSADLESATLELTTGDGKKVRTTAKGFIERVTHELAESHK
jgi:hypothetical protein